MSPPASRWSRLAWPATYLAAAAVVLAYHARAAAPGMAFVSEDLRYFFFAVRDATAASLRAGHLPGWQRGMFVGFPLLADPQAAVFDPATWLTLPWSAPRALTLATLLHLCVAACGMVWWLRERGLAPAEALLGATLFAIGAKETVHIQHWNFAASTAWWPWMLGGLEAFAERGRGRYLLVTAVAAALSWCGGAPQMAYFGTLVSGAYALVLAPRLWRRRRVDAVLALAAAPLGLLLAAPAVLPAAEMARLGLRGEGVAYRFATSWRWPDRWGLALLLLPQAFAKAGAWRLEMNLWEATGYLGVLPLGLLATAPLRRRACWLFLALGVIGVWLCFGERAWLGLHHAFFRWLPGYGAFRNPTRSLMVTSFAAAVLAAEALGALRRPDLPRRRILAAAAVLALAAALAPTLPGLDAFSLDRDLARDTAPLTAALALAGLGWLGLRAWRHPGRGWSSAWALAAVALVAVDLHLAFGDMNEVAPAAGERPALADLAPFLPPPPSPRRVAVTASWGRVTNAPLRQGWEGATGYGPTAIQRVSALLFATADGHVAAPAPLAYDLNFPVVNPASPLWPLLGAPIVVSDRALPFPILARLAPEWDRPTAAYAAPALPRVFWCGTWEARGDRDVTEPLVRAARGDRVVVADDADRSVLPPPGPPEGPVAAERVATEGGLVEATLTAPRAGLAVALEPWFPGWSATLDGRPVPIVRADHAFMAVPVPEGRHVLRLVYEERQVGRGAWIATGALALLLLALGVRRRTARVTV